MRFYEIGNEEMKCQIAMITVVEILPMPILSIGIMAFILLFAMFENQVKFHRSI